MKILRCICKICSTTSKPELSDHLIRPSCSSKIHDLMQEDLPVFVRYLVAGKVCIKESSLEPRFGIDLAYDQFLYWLGELVQLASRSVAADVIDECLGEHWAKVLNCVVDGALQWFCLVWEADESGPELSRCLFWQRLSARKSFEGKNEDEF